MIQRHHAILNGLAAFSLCLCVIAVSRLPDAYREPWTRNVGGYGVVYTRSGQYSDPPAARAEAWAAVIVTAVLPVAWSAARVASAWRARRGHARVARGRCPACGYDCRATPDRCPECGRTLPTESHS